MTNVIGANRKNVPLPAAFVGDAKRCSLDVGSEVGDC